MTERPAGNNNNPPAVVPPTGLSKEKKRNLSKENDIKLLEQLKLGF